MVVQHEHNVNTSWKKLSEAVISVRDSKELWFLSANHHIIIKIPNHSLKSQSRTKTYKLGAETPV